MLGLTLMLSCDGSCWAVVSTSRLKSERMRRTVSEPIAIANRAQDHERQQRRDAGQAHANRQPVERCRHAFEEGITPP